MFVPRHTEAQSCASRRLRSEPAVWLPHSPTNQSFAPEHISVEALLDSKEGEPYNTLIEEVRQGLKLHEPELCEEGVNGTYFLRSTAGDIIAIFKPRDEEGCSPKNPKNSKHSTPSWDVAELKKGIKNGEGAPREVAAYLLDKETGFASVPRTVMVALHHPIFDGNAVHSLDHGLQLKIGSLQEFIPNEGSAEDLAPNLFSVRDAHRIAILDLRIFNNDRHAGNLLVQEREEGGYKLIPIDHSYSLSDTLSTSWFDWLNWPQAKVPFDQVELDYIQAIDLDKDLNMLERLGIRKECLKTCRISTTLLKKGAAKGLTLFEIGSMASRMDPDEPCLLEQLYEEACERAHRTSGTKNEKVEEETFALLCKLIDEHLDKKDVLEL